MESLKKSKDALPSFSTSSSCESFKSVYGEECDPNGYVTPPLVDIIVAKPKPQKTPPGSPPRAFIPDKIESAKNLSLVPSEVWSSPQSSSNSTKSAPSSNSTKRVSPFKSISPMFDDFDFLEIDDNVNIIYILIKDEGKKNATVYFGPFNENEANALKSCKGRSPPDILMLKDLSEEDISQLNPQGKSKTHVARFGLNDTGKNESRLQKRSVLFDSVESQFSQKVYKYENIRKDFIHISELQHLTKEKNGSYQEIYEELDKVLGRGEEEYFVKLTADPLPIDGKLQNDENGTPEPILKPDNMTHQNNSGKKTRLRSETIWCKDQKCSMWHIKHQVIDDICNKGVPHHQVVNLCEISDLKSFQKSIKLNESYSSNPELSKIAESVDDMKIDCSRCTRKVSGSLSAPLFEKEKSVRFEFVANAVNSGHLTFKPEGGSLRTRTASGSSLDTRSIVSISDDDSIISDFSELSSRASSRAGTPMPLGETFEVVYDGEDITMGINDDPCKSKCLICFSANGSIGVDLFPSCLEIGSAGDINCWQSTVKSPRNGNHSSIQYCCKTAKNAAKLYCCRPGCKPSNDRDCKRRHIIGINRLATRTKLCSKEDCKIGNCNNAHYPEEVRKRFSTLCLQRILDYQTDDTIHSRDWKMFFPQVGKFDTLLSFFDYIHQTLADWMIENDMLWRKSQAFLSKHTDMIESDIRDTKNLVRNITIWSNCAYSNGRIKNEQYLIWSCNNDTNHYCEDIVRLFGAKSEVEGHHVIINRSGESVPCHKSLGCKDGNKCVFFINCYKGFHTIREFIKPTPKSSLRNFQYINSYDSKKARYGLETNQIKLEVDENIASPKLMEGHKYMLKCMKTNYIVRLVKITEERLSPFRYCVFQRIDNSDFKDEDIETCPELLFINKLVSKPMHSFSGENDTSIDKDRLFLEKGDEFFTNCGLEKGEKYLLRVFIDRGEEDVFYDELIAIYKEGKRPRSASILRYFEIKEGVIPKKFIFSKVEVYQNFTIGTKKQNEACELLIPIVEKNFIDTSFICSQKSKDEIIVERHRTYKELCELIELYNTQVDGWHGYEEENFTEMKYTLEHISNLYLGEAVLHGKQMIAEKVVSQSDSEPFTLTDISQFPTLDECKKEQSWRNLPESIMKTTSPNESDNASANQSISSSLKKKKKTKSKKQTVKFVSLEEKVAKSIGSSPPRKVGSSLPRKVATSIGSSPPRKNKKVKNKPSTTSKEQKRSSESKARMK